jgi:hypothetical protein
MCATRAHGGFMDPATVSTQTESDLNRSKSSLRSGFDVLGKASGFLALVVSLIHPTIELWNKVHQAPSTIADNKGSTMEMKYDPTSQSLELVFSAALRNDGNKDDMLQGVTAFLAGGEAGQSQRVKNEDVGIATNAASAVTLPYPISLGSQQLHLSARFALGDSAIRAFRKQSEWQVNVRLSTEGKNQPFPLRYCFYVSDAMIHDLFAAKKLYQRHFLETMCTEKA